ncbi:hypothetical protein NK212_06190 [Elizabethkingia sp. S0634]|uniref:DUF6876 family protein n=1 Tax=Elizabethkingia sp. S0634 TaxID=2957806 RepID=UPI0020A14C2C|nr:DUF6876 family protein [Elizabethkingia sp. S0634]MCP1251438.1 hypothetical protein [Elizabethkingia sp. S0634]
MEELFERYEKLKATCNKWSKIESRKGLDYKDCEAFQKECEKIGFTFDFGLSAEPNNLRAIEINAPLDKHLTSDNANQHFDSYTGTQCYYKYNLGFFLTDGSKDFAEHLQCFWLLDILISVQGSKITNNPFQVWYINRIGRTDRFLVTAEDGNNKILYHQLIEYSDFKHDSAKLYLNINESEKIIFLPSEY